MPIANEELDALDRFIAAATPGPWTASCRDVDGPKKGDLIGISQWPDDEFLGCEVYGPNANVGRGDYVGRDAAYIAALNPLAAQRLTATIREQAAEIERLRKDAERLDYLIKCGAQVIQGGGCYLYWHTSNRMGPVQKTPREAIDAAIAAQGGGAKS